jgi:hypothetical protein
MDPYGSYTRIMEYQIKSIVDRELTTGVANERASAFLLRLDKAVEERQEELNRVAAEERHIDGRQRWLNGVSKLSPEEFRKNNKMIDEAEKKIAEIRREGETTDSEITVALREWRRELELEEMMQKADIEVKQRRVKQLREEIERIKGFQKIGWS